MFLFVVFMLFAKINFLCVALIRVDGSRWRGWLFKSQNTVEQYCSKKNRIVFCGQIRVSGKSVSFQLFELYVFNCFHTTSMECRYVILYCAYIIYIFYIYIYMCMGYYNISLTWITVRSFWDDFRMISLTNHDSSEGEQWGLYNLPIYIYIYIYIAQDFWNLWPWVATCCQDMCTPLLGGWNLCLVGGSP